MTAETAHAPRMYTVPEVLAMCRMGRTTFYREVNAGRLAIIKRGSSTRVTAADLDAYIGLLRAEAENAR
jgi:predicted DNA-binding transcriptional regulator AlpA